MANHTVFGDLRRGAASVYRVHTQGSVYVLGVHEAKGRKYVVLRGLPGTDREHVVIRDSDPRIGESSLFDVPVHEWVGKMLEVATMTTSPILKAERETDLAIMAAFGGERSPWARPTQQPAAGSASSEPPAGQRHAPPIPGELSPSPRIQPGLSRGTLGGYYVLGSAEPREDAAKPAAPAKPAYPASHLRYAEDAAALLRALTGRESLFEDLAFDRSALTQLRKALDDCAAALETLRRRDRK